MSFYVEYLTQTFTNDDPPELVEEITDYGHEDTIPEAEALMATANTELGANTDIRWFRIVNKFPDSDPPFPEQELSYLSPSWEDGG